MKSRTFLFAAALLVAGATTAGAQSIGTARYTPPRPGVLSADLASPWLLQLRNKPSADGSYAVRIAPPLPPSQTQLRGGISTFAYNQPAPVRQTTRAERAAILKRQTKAHAREIDPKYEIHTVAYDTTQPAGTIVIDTHDRFLYLVLGDGKARRYGIGVGRDGFRWSGTEHIARKAEWPGWTPPKEMIAREAARDHFIPDHMDGGPGNPLGARAMYLFHGDNDTLYRIHGTNQPWTIGKAVSSGCIRMRDEDVIDLYERVKVGTKVVVS